jgi:hypothetical protein
MLRPVEGSTARLNLEIESGSDPIAGSIGGPGEEPRSFRGWIELAEAIETVRATRAARPKTGVLPWGEEGSPSLA